MIIAIPVRRKIIHFLLAVPSLSAVEDSVLRVVSVSGFGSHPLQNVKFYRETILSLF